jgi:hypothetical protein
MGIAAFLATFRSIDRLIEDGIDEVEWRSLFVSARFLGSLPVPCCSFRVRPAYVSAFHWQRERERRKEGGRAFCFYSILET